MQKKVKNIENIEGKKIFKYGMIVLVFLGGMYLLTSALVTKNRRMESTKVDNGSVAIQYSEILLGEVFHQSEGEYLVLCYDKEKDSDTYKTIISKLEQAEKIKLYTVDLSSAFNKKLVKDESNKTPTKASEIAVSGATLFYFKDDNLTSYIEGKEEITAFVEPYQE